MSHIRTIISVAGPDRDDTGSRRQTLGHRRTVRGGVEDGRVVVHIQYVEVDPDRAGLAAAILSPRRQDVVLLGLVVQRACHVENSRHRVQEEHPVLVVLLQRVRDLAVHP